MPNQQGAIDTMHEFIISCDGRPRVGIPSLQWLWGSRRHPFRVGATLKNAAVTSSDLTSQDAWYEDVQVRTAYTPTDGATTKLRAILNIEAVRLFIVNATFSALAVTVKDVCCQGLSIRADIGGTAKRIDLRDSVREAPKEFQKTQATATLADWWLLKGDWAEVGPGSMQVDLETNTLILESTNSVTYGADVSAGVYVEFIGHMVPKGTPGGTAYIPGGTAVRCGGVGGDFAVTAPNIIQQVASLPPLRGLAIG